MGHKALLLIENFVKKDLEQEVKRNGFNKSKEMILPKEHRAFYVCFFENMVSQAKEGYADTFMAIAKDHGF